jgi:hypothetical protein
MTQATEWSEVVNTTTAEYLKGAADTTIRDRVVFAMLNRRKRIQYGQSGTELRWQVKFAMPDVETYTGGAIDFQPTDKHRQLLIDWKGYVVPDVMHEKERLMNRGNQALIDRYARIFPDMEQSLTDRFGLEFYVDGTSYADRFAGIETFLTAGTCVVADKIAAPAGTYGGISTVLGAVAGSWSANLTTSPNASTATDWPGGQGDPEYCFMSPKLVNWSSNSWGTGSVAWVDNCERVLRQTTMWTQNGQGKSGRTDMYLMTPAMYVDYLNKQSAKQSIIVPAKELIELGFEGVQQEGVQLTTDWGCPDDTAYGVNFDKMWLHMMYDNLFVNKGPEFDIRTQSWLFLLATYGNFRFESPMWFSKIHNYAAA